MNDGAKQSPFAYDLSKLSNMELLQLRQNVLAPPRGGKTERDVWRRQSAETAIDEEMDRRGLTALRKEL